MNVARPIYRGAILGSQLLLLGFVSCKFDALPPVEDDAADASDAAPIDTGDDATGPDAMEIDAHEFNPQCDGVATNCGPSSNDSCCATATTIPAGMHLRSYDAATDAYNDMSFPVSLSSYKLDKYEITVGRFRAFLESGYGTQLRPPVAGAGAHPNLPGSGWDTSWNNNLAADRATLLQALKCNATYQTWTDTAGADENKPLNCISWFDAMAFCIWDGGYLPTEAEWDHAALGGDEQRAYPWSNPPSSLTVDCSRANFNNSPGTTCVGRPARVGSVSPAGDGRWGQSDLAGNVWEWTLDVYVDPYPLPCSNCANLSPPTGMRNHRGGSFYYDAVPLRGARREAANAVLRTADRGARCARQP